MSKYLLFLFFFFLFMPYVELLFFHSEACVWFFSFSFFNLLLVFGVESFILSILSFILGALCQQFFFLFPASSVPHFFLSLELSFFLSVVSFVLGPCVNIFFFFLFLFFGCRIFLVFGVEFFFLFFVVSFAFSLSPLTLTSRPKLIPNCSWPFLWSRGPRF